MEIDPHVVYGFIIAVITILFICFLTFGLTGLPDISQEQKTFKEKKEYLLNLAPHIVFIVLSFIFLVVAIDMFVFIYLPIEYHDYNIGIIYSIFLYIIVFLFVRNYLINSRYRYNSISEIINRPFLLIIIIFIVASSFLYFNYLTPDIYNCSKRNLVVRLEYLIEVKRQNPFRKNESGQSLLHLASENGNLNVLKLLISKQADVNILDKHKRTPLHYASINGHNDIVNYLISNGATINLTDSENENITSLFREIWFY